MPRLRHFVFLSYVPFVATFVTLGVLQTRHWKSCFRGLHGRAGEVLSEEVESVLFSLVRKWGNAFEGVGDAEFLVLVGAHGVVGEKFDAFHIVI